MKSSSWAGLCRATGTSITSTPSRSGLLGTLPSAVPTNKHSRSNGIMYHVRNSLKEDTPNYWLADMESVQPSFASISPTSTSARMPVVNVVNEILNLSLAEISTALDNKTVSSVQLTEACLSQIEQTKDHNIYISVLTESALEAARASDSRISTGNRLSALDGIPVSLKDNFSLMDSLTTAGSSMLSNFRSPYDSTIATRLKESGAVIIGKTNLDEFGMGSYTLNSASGPTSNPLGDIEQPTTCGGSSGGAAAALVARTCFLSIGSDTGGSVRLPAAYTGIVGLKPTYGHLSRWGLIAYASSLDTPGLMAHSARDLRIALALLSGRDGLDSSAIFPSVTSTATTTAFSTSELNYVCRLRQFMDFIATQKKDSETPLKGLRVGIPEQLIFDELSQDVMEMWDCTAQTLRELGADVVLVSIPALDKATAAYYVIAPSEAVSNLSRYDGVRFGPSKYTTDPATVASLQTEIETSESIDGKKRTMLQGLYETNRSSFFGEEVRKRIMLGNFALSSAKQKAFSEKAMEVRGRLIGELESLFTISTSTSDAASSGVHFMLFPTSKGPAPTFAEIEDRKEKDPMGAYVDDVMTVFANLAGLPTLAFPAGMTSDSKSVSLPLGMQLMGSPLVDDALLEVGELIHARMTQKQQ